jgi:hypothetical protein
MGLSCGNVTVARFWPLMTLGVFETAPLSGLKPPLQLATPAATH